MEWQNNQYLITDDPQHADIDFITAALNTTYWAAGRPRKVIELAVQNSVVLSLFDHQKPVELTRIVSDYITFAWICDVYIEPAYRARGLGKWLMECTMAHPAANTRLRQLVTRDAHGLYEKYGFEKRECMWSQQGKDFYKPYA